MNAVKLGKIEEYMRKRIEKDGALHITLIDPAEQPIPEAVRIIKEAVRAGTDVILVGGSVGASLVLNQTIQEIKKATDTPVVLFPGNVDGVSPYADAIFFMSLMNSRNPYWITGAQALAAPIIKRFQKESGLESIPMAYLIVEPGASTAAGWVGEANQLPTIKPKLAAAYAMAAELFGHRLVYLEAGSGAPSTVPADMIRIVRASIDIPIIVGGGIRTPELAAEKVRAGADIIVTGTIVEHTGDVYSKIKPIIDAIKAEGKKKVKER